MSHSELNDGGLIPHHTLDLLYTLFTTGQLRLQLATPDVSSPPTDAELDAVFGTPAEVGPGFLRLIDDNAAGSALYIIASDGANWWHFTATKAV
jgi:hypothetical protein